MLSQNLYRKIEAKTASYQIKPGDIGKIFTNTGATADLTLTLPPVADLLAGWWCRFFLTADFAILIASSGSADNIAAFNDAAADSIAITTSGEHIGAGGELVWDGTNWLAFINLGQDTQSVTVA